MLRSSIALLLVALGIALAVGVTCRDPYAHILQSRPARWVDYAAVLERDVGPIEYLGGVGGLLRGGCDVWRARNGDWWLIGPGRRFNRCTPETSLEVSDRVIRDAAREMDAEQ